MENLIAYLKTSSEPDAAMRRGAQADLARRLGITGAYMSELVAGKKLPSFALMCLIEKETSGAVPVLGWVPVERVA